LGWFKFFTILQVELLKQLNLVVWLLGLGQSAASLNTARGSAAGAGTHTAGLVFGGSSTYHS
jgi:hypothetical protein